MTVSLVLHDDLTRELVEAASQPLETAGVLLVNEVQGPSGDIRLLGDAVRWVSGDAYIKREADELVIASQGYVPALGEAADRGLLPIWLHTHPGQGGIPMPSRHDHKVDAQLAETFRLRAGVEAYGALILSPSRALGLKLFIDAQASISVPSTLK